MGSAGGPPPQGPPARTRRRPRALVVVGVLLVPVGGAGLAGGRLLLARVAGGAIGGQRGRRVAMCVDEETTSVHVGHDAAGRVAAPFRHVPPDDGLVVVPGVRPQVHHPGCQEMNGRQALDYVRQRYLISDGDDGRQRHQRISPTCARIPR